MITWSDRPTGEPDPDELEEALRRDLRAWAELVEPLRSLAELRERIRARCQQRRRRRWWWPA